MLSEQSVAVLSKSAPTLACQKGTLLIGFAPLEHDPEKLALGRDPRADAGKIMLIPKLKRSHFALARQAVQL